MATDLPGYAIGGVSVGEGHELLCKVTEHTAPLLPEGKPRYLMGVGLPEDLVAAIGYGIDLFDCVIPTRYARSASAFTARGRIRLTNRRYRRDAYPIDTSCDCATCAAGFEGIASCFRRRPSRVCAMAHFRGKVGEQFFCFV